MSTQTHHSTTDTTDEPILNVDSLDVTFDVPGDTIHALRDVSLSLEQGETLGIAGESGSGKSTLALAIVRYLDNNGQVANGSIKFDGQDLLNASKKELQSIRGKRIAHVAQNPATSLNPSMTILEQIKETIKLHQDVDGDTHATQRAYEVLKRVNIPDPAETALRYPHELSGGQQQRALLAIGLSCNPELLILDEPTTGLDVTTQAKFLDLVEELKTEFDAGILLITHNLGVIAEIADRVNILYGGEMMEKGPVDDVFTNPANPYTQALLATTPEMGVDKDLRPIPGQIPDLDDIPDGCIFADRCEFATDECQTGGVEMEPVDPATGHQSRCWRWETAVNDPIEAESAPLSDTVPGDTILRANGLTKHYDEPTFIQKYLGNHNPVQAVSDVSLDLRESATLGLVGESGCGKSTLGRTLLALHDLTDGTIEYRGESLEELDDPAYREFRSECQIIFQDPEASLNPSKTVKQILQRPLTLFTDLDASEHEERIAELVTQVNLGSEVIRKKPHELSGGQQQRVSIARAFAANPSLIVLDEPVSSLDVSVQASILNLLDELRAEYDTSYLFISHDLSVIESVCDEVAVMYLGEIIESGSVEDIFAPPHHPYTRALLSSIPSLSPEEESVRLRLEGDVPSAKDPPSGCSFHTRCPQKIGDVCKQRDPSLEPVNEDGSHCLSCHLDEEELNHTVNNAQTGAK